MTRIQEIKKWLQEGNLHLAEKAIQDCANNLKPEEKEEFNVLLDELSVHQFRLLAGKAVAAKDEKLLLICIARLREKNSHTEGIQDSLNRIISERRTIRFQKYLAIVFVAIILLLIGLFLLS